MNQHFIFVKDQVGVIFKVLVSFRDAQSTFKGSTIAGARPPTFFPALSWEDRQSKLLLFDVWRISLFFLSISEVQCGVEERSSFSPGFRER